MRELAFLFLFITSSALFGQGIEQNESVLLIKANVLYEEGRYDEAVRMYNRILSINDSYSAALLMRAKAKYQLGAYKGTKIDAVKHMQQSGVNKELIRLMASTEFRMDNMVAASNYVQTAIELDQYDSDMYLLAGDIALAYNLQNNACENYAKAAQLGERKAVLIMEKTCLGYTRPTSQKGNPTNKSDQSTRTNSDTEDSTNNNNGGLSKGKLDDILDKEGTAGPSKNDDELQTRNDMPPPNKSAKQDIKIDEKLTLTITNGLGERKVENLPQIFMLAGQAGAVVIDICVDENGKVTSTAFNRNRSTVYRSSLTSLALRKSKEFVFLPSLRSEQCGSVVFNLKS